MNGGHSRAGSPHGEPRTEPRPPEATQPTFAIERWRSSGYPTNCVSLLESDSPREMMKMGDASFALIEKKITDLVQVVTALKKEKETLAGELARKDGEVKELTRKLTELSKERVEVKDRVEKILSRLDTIEL